MVPFPFIVNSLVAASPCHPFGLERYTKVLVLRFAHKWKSTGIGSKATPMILSSPSASAASLSTGGGGILSGLVKGTEDECFGVGAAYVGDGSCAWSTGGGAFVGGGGGGGSSHHR